MSRPALQYYPGDVRRNANLSRCSWAARGVWFYVMGLMHDSDEYGVLRWPLKEVALATGAPMPLLNELVEKSVMKGIERGICKPYSFTPRHAGRSGAPVLLVPAQDGPIWYSSRMIRDEYIRQRRGQNTRFGPAPEPPPKGGIGEDLGVPPKAPPTRDKGDGPSSASASSITSLIISSSLTTEERAPNLRRADIAVLLRELGVTCTFAHPTIWTWVTGGVTDDRLRAAVAIARRYKPPPEPIPIAYVAKIVDGLAESDREPDWDAVFQRSDDEAQA